MGMPSELWPRSRVKAHFGWIDRFLPGPKENNAACPFNRANSPTIPRWRCVWRMRCWNVKARSIRI
ncbi:ADP-ribosylglycohydrolase [Escherichia coli]